MSRRRTAVALPSLLLAAGLLAGCGGNGDTATASSSGTAGSAPAAESTQGGTPSGGSGEGAAEGGDAPAFPANAEPDSADPSADSLVTVTDIRTGGHEGFDRVVFEVEGTGTPGWDVRYVDQAISQGSGEPVAVAGGTVLQVTLTGVGYPYDTGADEWTGPDPLSGTDTDTVTEVAWDATFEGTSVAFVGTTEEVPFRVYALEGPTRIVLEVADPS
ncbi:AMIN-like domain-containing (lipo)protein [Geodermatophilus ruber]|uniref:AMIN-like domain-containing protein n=1 Tax=Geodermatophilus ruber TaxID=504800 RepID=A0A1I3Z0K1_9ACTN|nr:hypothetical protein [Geodermatophilus ruber]SFK37598.1 hypothetical protein SAMN04488085_101287 [Geodermatophilus ruber]